jgi:D-lactate dehydrogenase (cytochrome)
MTVRENMSEELNMEEQEDLLRDASNFKGECEEILIPSDRFELQEMVVRCNESKTKITTSASRTGLTGGCVPQGGALILTRKLNRVMGFNPNKCEVTCEPGALLSDLQKYLHDFGFFFPADPTEELCTIGGVVANNSSGATSFKYGAARNYIQSLQIVLSDGLLMAVKRGDTKERFGHFSFTTSGDKTFNVPAPNYKMPDTKNAAGYFSKKGSDLIDLFIGSEGTLGIFWRIKLKVEPLPEKLFSCVAYFNTVEDALGFINDGRTEFKEQQKLWEDYTVRSTAEATAKQEHDPVRETPDVEHGTLDNAPNEGIIPDEEQRVEELPVVPRPGLRALEFFDGKALEFLREDYPRIPEGMEAAVWFEVETDELNLDKVMAEWADKITSHNSSLEDAWLAYDAGDLQEIKKFRHAISYKVNEYISKNGFMKLGTDTAVAVEYFDEYYSYATKMVQDAGIEYVTYGHFGDCHLHLNMLPKDSVEYIKGKEIYLELCKKAVEHGGTVSAEHGIGKLKKEYLKLMYGEKGINEMKKVKKYLDPNNLLNIGNLFD